MLIQLLTLLGNDQNCFRSCQKMVTVTENRQQTQNAVIFFFYTLEMLLFTRNAELGIKTKYN